MDINQKIISEEHFNFNNVFMDFLWILTDIFCNYGALEEEKNDPPAIQPSFGPPLWPCAGRPSPCGAVGSAAAAWDAPRWHCYIRFGL